MDNAVWNEEQFRTDVDGKSFQKASAMTTVITLNWYGEKEKLKKDSRRVVIFFPAQTEFIKNQKAD